VAGSDYQNQAVSIVIRVAISERSSRYVPEVLVFASKNLFSRLDIRTLLPCDGFAEAKPAVAIRTLPLCVKNLVAV